MIPGVIMPVKRAQWCVWPLASDLLIYSRPGLPGPFTNQLWCQIGAESPWRLWARSCLFGPILDCFAAFANITHDKFSHEEDISVLRSSKRWRNKITTEHIQQNWKELLGHDQWFLAVNVATRHHNSCAALFVSLAFWGGGGAFQTFLVNSVWLADKLPLPYRYADY